MDSEDILKVLCDSLHYPDFNNAWEKLNTFEQNELMQYLDDVINEAYQDGYEECESEYSDSFDSGYENCVRNVIKTLKRFTDDEDFVEKVRRELIEDDES